MEPKTFFLRISLCLAATSCLPVAIAGSLTTLRNSPLSVRTAEVAAAVSAGCTNLAGPDFMVSAVVPATLEGGKASLVNAQQWAQCYDIRSTASQYGAQTVAILTNGNVIVAGSSASLTTGYDFVTLGYAPDGTALWTNRYDGPAHAADSARFVATGGTGDIWVAGDSRRYSTNWSLDDAVLLKYAADGNPVWTNRFTPTADTNDLYVNGLVVDASGNAYVRTTATYWESSGVGRPIENTITKFDSLGTALWTKHFPQAAPDSGGGLHDVEAMALDRAGNMLAGGMSGSEHYSTGTSIVKYDGDGNALWTNHCSGEVMDLVRLIAVDHQENIIVTGESFSSGTVGYVVLKCSPEGTALWTNLIAGPLYDGGNVPQTQLDDRGNLYFVGGSPGVFHPGLYHILKLSPDGVDLWENLSASFGTTNSMISDSALDNAGNLFLVGATPYPADSDFVAVKYSKDGLALGTNRFDGPGRSTDTPLAVAVDGSGNLYVSGQSNNSFGGRDLVTVKYAELLFYTPPQNFTGSDTITCTLTDNHGDSETANVPVLVVDGSFQFDLSSTATRLTSSGIQLQLDGAPATDSVIIEVSTDLANWQPLLTNIPVNGSVQLLDPAAPGAPQRFYRARQGQ